MIRQPHRSRDRLAVPALLALAAGLSACGSGTSNPSPPPATAGSSSHPASSSAAPSVPPSSVPPSTPAHTATSTAATSGPGTGATASGKPISAYWFTIGSSFPGGRNWTVASVTQPTDPNGLGPSADGSILIDGPADATIRFDAPDGNASGDPDLRSAVQDTVSGEQVKVSQGPKQISVGGQQALAVSGLDPAGNDTILVVIGNDQDGYYADASLSCPTADFAADQAAFQALLNSFRFEN